jgi:hypothetical protein
MAPTKSVGASAPPSQRDDFIWKHFDQICKRKGTNWHAKCLVCLKIFQSINANKAHAHIAGIRGQDVAICQGPNEDDEMCDYTEKEFELLSKHKAQQKSFTSKERE